MRLSLSVADTNRLRAQLGLRLIPEGPDTLVEDGSTPSDRVKQLQARMVAAEERAEERALHAAATEGPSLKSGSSTVSWLDKMRQKRDSSSSAKSTEVAQNVSSPEKLRTHPEHVATSAEASDSHSRDGEADTQERTEPVSNSASSYVRTSPKQDLTALDPLEAPAEPERNLKRQAHLDFDGKKAVFKPKKLKSGSRARARSVEPPPVEPPLIQEDTSALEQALFKARKELTQRSAGHTDTFFSNEKSESLSIANDREPDAGSLIIGPTQTFLREVQRNKEDSPTSLSANHGESLPDSLESHKDAAVDRLSDGESTTDQVDDPIVTNSVADTLRALKRESKPALSSQDVSRSRREWTRKLESARLAKQAELASSLEAFRHLPPGERQKAYEMQKKEMAAQDAKAAEQLFQDYTPSVELEHRDEHGNIIDGRKAFKLLSGAFHGTKARGNSTKAQDI